MLENDNEVDYTECDSLLKVINELASMAPAKDSGASRRLNIRLNLSLGRDGCTRTTKKSIRVFNSTAYVCLEDGNKKNWYLPTTSNISRRKR